MRNKFVGTCFRCNKKVPTGAGFFQRTSSLSPAKRPSKKWVVRCKECVGTGN